MSIQLIQKFFPVLFALSLLTLNGCGPPAWWKEGFEGESINAEQGGVWNAMHLPVPEGRALQCVQGAGGSYSHQGTSTSHDLDLDTSNSAHEELFAPATGIAYVHTQSATTNFGYHVNIDVGGGYYIVIAHMKEIFVETGQEVALGQLIGYEGCTGACTGDHIHIGLHRGDAAQKAEYGTSVEANYRAADVTLDGPPGVISGDEFVCGISQLGDPVSGHTYRSQLEVAHWHPNGTLVRAPDSEKVYRIDDGELRWITTEDVFWSYGYRFGDVALISEEEMDCYAEGPPIDQEGMVEAAYHAQTGQLWLIVGSEEHSNKFRQAVRPNAWNVLLESWGAPYTTGDPPPVLDPDHPYFTDWPVLDEYARFRPGTLLSPEDASDVFVISGQQAQPIEDWQTLLLMGFGGRQILPIEDEDLQIIQQEIGDCAIGWGCIGRESVTTCGGGTEIGNGDQGGASDDEEELEEEDDEEDPVDLSGELSLDPDEFGVIHAAPAGYDAIYMALSGEGKRPDGSTVFPWTVLATSEGSDPISWQTSLLQPGDTFRYSVEMQEEMGIRWSCEDGVGQVGSVFMAYGSEEIPVSTLPSQGGGCSLIGTVPGFIPEESDTDTDTDTDSDTDADTDTDTDSDTDSDTDTDSDSDTDSDTDTGFLPATLSVTWTTPFVQSAEEITLSGEYLFAGGGYGFTWRELTEVEDQSSITYTLPGVVSGDSFRFSVEYEDTMGNVSWSCIGPFPPGAPQGLAVADVDGSTVPIELVGDPSGQTTGCGLILEIP